MHHDGFQIWSSTTALRAGCRGAVGHRQMTKGNDNFDDGGNSFAFDQIGDVGFVTGEGTAVDERSRASAILRRTPRKGSFGGADSPRHGGRVGLFKANQQGKTLGCALECPRR